MIKRIRENTAWMDTIITWVKESIENKNDREHHSRKTMDDHSNLGSSVCGKKKRDSGRDEDGERERE